MSDSGLFVRFTKGDISVGVHDSHMLGKRPSLFYSRGNAYFKLASFSSLESAQKFIAVMEELLGLADAE